MNTSSVSTLLSYLSQSTHSPITETNSSSYITPETKKEVTTLPSESFFSKSISQATVDDLKTTSAITSNLIAQVSTSVPLISSKLLLSVSSNQLPAGAGRLKKSEAILTISFSILLALTILGFTVYILNKYRKRRNQYAHHPLYDTSSETVDRYTIPDDVLVISGGLYDAPRIYNQNMVYEDDELQNDYLPFSAQPGHLRLESLPEEKEQDFFPTYETFQIPPGDL
ncbi:uncharacterized protein LOC121927962 [Sceloporus undulatus]|uniref:uncharacterized protein LOC121927962 n=1 Tax=Sceloporus undulatus TaxID=8520 RepID=UPI001C4CC27A|nr:uncharacterized protein LOC121927962 [Sceloporus undulatus]